MIEFLLTSGKRHGENGGWDYRMDCGNGGWIDGLGTWMWRGLDMRSCDVDGN